MSGIGERMIVERRREVAVSCTALYAMQAHHGNPYFSFLTIGRDEQAHWINQAEIIVPPAPPIVQSTAWDPRFCFKCGRQEVIAYDESGALPPICPDCCEKDDHNGFGVGHEFEHHDSGGRRETLCMFCSAEPSPDWYADMDDRGL